MTIRQSPSGKFIDVGDGVAPLSSFRWVDPETATPLADQTGSELAPFSTIAGAVAALEASGVASGTVALVDANYDGATLDLKGLSIARIELQGFGGAVNIGQIEMAGTTALQLENVGNADAVGVASVAGLSGTPSVKVVGGSLGLLVGAIDAVLVDAVCTGGGSALSIDANGSTFDGALSVLQVARFRNCEALDDAPVTAEQVFMQGCNWAGDLTTTTAMQLIDHYGFVGSGSANVDAGSGLCEARNVRFAGTVDAGQLIIDSVSYQAGLAGGVVFTQLSLQISDAPITAAVVVAVPAVSAGQVGYVTTSLVGTTLEGLFATNNPVIVNPQADLVAAGAGGALVNARIPSANNLRCTFVGPLAGGNATFTITKGR